MIERTTETCECGGKLYWNTKDSKWCYKCNTNQEIEDERTSVEILTDEFNDGLQIGIQLEAIQNASRLVADEFAMSPESDEIENPEFDAYLAKMEISFDEWWAKNPNSPRVKFQIGSQCRNFLAAIRKRYVPVALVKKATTSLNSRERSLIWATWKGFSHRVYYPKG